MYSTTNSPAAARQEHAPQPSPSYVPFLREDIEQSIPARFEQQVRLHADRLAVKTAQHAWTYDILNRAANRIAHTILARDRNGRTPVVLLLEQSAPLIAAYLGALKAGKILVALDPTQPSKRLAQLLEEAQATCIVTTTAFYDIAIELAGDTLPVVNVDALAPEVAETNPPVVSAPSDPAMIFYTSGSTGRPKGILCNHLAWVHNSFVYANKFQIGAEDRVTLLALGTSQAIKNLVIALLNGAAVFPYEVRQQGLPGLAVLMRREEITITVMGASLFRSFVDVLDDDAQFPKLRLIRLGSETVRKEDVELYKKHFPRTCLLVNGLASGETQTIRFFCIDHDTVVDTSIVPVGYAVQEKTVLLLGDDGDEVQADQVGEIVVRSPYLALGYWRQADLTNAAFRPAELPEGPRLYYTGDLGRLSADGCLTCLGRKNARVKVRGYGVDLVEVEIALGNLTDIKDAVVTAQQNRAGYNSLVAYVVPRVFPGPSNMTLRQQLAESLPDYMVPSTFVALSALPRTSSGKIDRQALPAPGRPYRDGNRPAVAPRTPMEKSIAAIWSEILDREVGDVHDHYYDLGGESLQAMRIMARIRKTFNVDVDLQSLIDAPTVAQMAAQVAKGLMTGLESRDPEACNDNHAQALPQSQEWRYLVPLQPGRGHNPVFLIPGGVGADFFLYAQLAHHVGSEYPFYGLKARSADGKTAPHETVEAMARDYLAEIRSLQPRGPYTLVGECGAGLVAYEIARQLQAQGQIVAALILLDTPRPTATTPLRKQAQFFLEGLADNYYVQRWRHHREQWSNIRGKAKITYLLKKGRETVRELPDVQKSFSHEASARQIYFTKRGYSRAIYRYQPKPYSGKLTLLVNEESHRAKLHLGWQSLVAGKLEVHKTPGNHFTYLREHVQATAATIRECLKEI